MADCSKCIHATYAKPHRKGAKRKITVNLIVKYCMQRSFVDVSDVRNHRALVSTQAMWCLISTRAAAAYMSMIRTDSTPNDAW